MQETAPCVSCGEHCQQCDDKSVVEARQRMPGCTACSGQCVPRVMYLGRKNSVTVHTVGYGAAANETWQYNAGASLWEIGLRTALPSNPKRNRFQHIEGHKVVRVDNQARASIRKDRPAVRISSSPITTRRTAASNLFSDAITTPDTPFQRRGRSVRSRPQTPQTPSSDEVFQPFKEPTKRKLVFVERSMPTVTAPSKPPPPRKALTEAETWLQTAKSREEAIAGQEFGDWAGMVLADKFDACTTLDNTLNVSRPASSALNALNSHRREEEMVHWSTAKAHDIFNAMYCPIASGTPTLAKEGVEPIIATEPDAPGYRTPQKKRYKPTPFAATESSNLVFWADFAAATPAKPKNPSPVTVHVQVSPHLTPSTPQQPLPTKRKTTTTKTKELTMEEALLFSSLGISTPSTPSPHSANFLANSNSAS